MRHCVLEALLEILGGGGGSSPSAPLSYAYVIDLQRILQYILTTLVYCAMGVHFSDFIVLVSHYAFYG